MLLNSTMQESFSIPDLNLRIPSRSSVSASPISTSGQVTPVLNDAIFNSRLSGKDPDLTIRHGNEDNNGIEAKTFSEIHEIVVQNSESTHTPDNEKATTDEESTSVKSNDV